MSEIRLRIPENLDIDILFEEHKDYFEENGIKKPQMLYILDALQQSRTNKKKVVFYKQKISTPLCASILDKVVHNYNKYLNFLLDQKIFVTNGSFTKGMSRRYSYNDPYDGQLLKDIVVDDYILSRSIKREVKKNRERFRKENYGYGYLTKWWELGKLKIDEKKAFEFIEDDLNKKRKKLSKSKPEEKRADRIKLAVNTAENFKNACRRINEDSQRYHFKGEGNRFYHAVTNVKQELRNYLTYDGKLLAENDIKNCQPFLSLKLFDLSFWDSSNTNISKKLRLKDIDSNLYNKILNNNKYLYYKIITLLKTSETQSSKDLQEFTIKVLDGTFYEYIQEKFEPLYPGKFKNRKKVKKQVLRIFYSDPAFHNEDFYKPCLTFKSLFPTVYALFSIIKSVEYNLLPLILQRLESYLVIDVVCKKIGKMHPKIPFFTIHDSIITTKGNETIVKEILSSEFKNHLGNTPEVTVKYLHPDSVEKVREVKVKSVKKKHCIWGMVIDEDGLHEINEAGETREFNTDEYLKSLIDVDSKPVIDTCTGMEFSSEREAAIIKSIDFDTLIVYLNSDDNPTCLRYKAA